MRRGAGPDILGVAVESIAAPREATVAAGTAPGEVRAPLMLSLRTAISGGVDWLRVGRGAVARLGGFLATLCEDRALLLHPKIKYRRPVNMKTVLVITCRCPIELVNALCKWPLRRR